jgi:lysine-ketoglutarate reductase/saccharopine dehydrogenase-like protein (TIGR00300 family)
MVTETVFLDGHIVDSLTLSKVLDLILQHGGTYEIRHFKIGATRAETSRAEISVGAADAEHLENILHIIGQHGATRPTEEADWLPAPAHGAFPDSFYATTNLETMVRLGGHWVPVQPIEMDCAIVVKEADNSVTARSVPLHRVRKGDHVIVGNLGVKVTPLPPKDPTSVFSFMGSDVSTERPKELVVSEVAKRIRAVKAAGQKVLFVGGPAIVHTGASRSLEQLIRRRWIDVLFAGNALATHDIERALFGTSLGVEIDTGAPAVHGHEHHLRAINAIRIAGGIRQAVEQAVLTSGIMHACVETGTPYVLAGSIRDDGPLPDVIADAVAAQDRMREYIPGVGIAVMVATTLHSVATGNLLPASVTTLCVDSDADTVIKLMDRGSHQAFGLVTDCEFFLKELAARLAVEP